MMAPIEMLQYLQEIDFVYNNKNNIIMENLNMNQYESPQIEVLAIVVEKGFEGSVGTELPEWEEI